MLSSLFVTTAKRQTQKVVLDFEGIDFADIEILFNFM